MKSLPLSCLTNSYDCLPLVTQIEFKSEELTRLQVYWEHFLKRDKMENLPATIAEMIDKVNAFLKKLYER